METAGHSSFSRMNVKSTYCKEIHAMLQLNDAKVQEILQIIHKWIQKRYRSLSNNSDTIVLENRVLSILCGNYSLDPGTVARILYERYHYNMTGYDVMQIRRSMRLANPGDLKSFQWADTVADYFYDALQGNREAFDRFEKMRKTSAGPRSNITKERLLNVMIYAKYPEIAIYHDMDLIQALGNTLGKYYCYNIADAISEAYGFPGHRENKQKQQNDVPGLSREQALRKVERLERALEQTEMMLQDLQEEFAEQLETNKVKELTDFFALLNSEKYGCILDELLVVRRGVEKLRKSNFELPIEINGLLIVITKMIQFVRDSHIEPMMKTGSVKEVTAADLEFCNYEGSPFLTKDEIKTVKVISPGWIYRDKDVQISRPKVKEE